MSENTNTPKNQDELLAEEISARRNEVVQNFKVDFSVDDIPDVEVAYDDIGVEAGESAPQTVEEEPAEPVKVEKRRAKGESCLIKLIYLLIILGISGFLAAMSLFFILDSMAINREDRIVDFEVVQGSGTKEIADLLVENEVIDHAFCFRIYSKLTGADGKWQVGAFTLSPAMDYAALVETLQTMTPRPTVTVTIPEGFTVEEIAKVLDENDVCDKESFYDAVVNGQYEFDFLQNLPADGRAYRLEGYLFPDTYNFYMNSSGETVVTRMLENFDKKLTAEIRQQITDRGWSIDEAIVMASLIEGEAASKEDMEKVSKVLQNRMQPNSGFPKLELCSTRDYVEALSPTFNGVVVKADNYDTYDRTGLPVGAINNPGLQALMAALNPSTAKDMEKCYFFATDYNTGITYFSQSFSEHERICRKYKIGIYG